MVFRTTDGGENFKDITGNLPSDIPLLNLIAYNEDGITQLYAGTSLGVYYTDDIISNCVIEDFGGGIGYWLPIEGNLPATSVSELAVTDKDVTLNGQLQTVKFLRVATYGRGIWECWLPPMPDCTCECTANENLDAAFNIFYECSADNLI